MKRSLCISLISLATLAFAGPSDDAPAPLDQAAARMTLPPGFKATLFAGEPDIVKPIAMTTDDRGRLWVVESHSYPKWLTNGGPGKDRVLIFTDNSPNGEHFDSCKVFLDNGTNLSGIAIGFGGVWLCSTPNLLYIPLDPSGDKPAGPPVVVLDGWSLEAKHNVFNSLTWGPDSWLYGCNGILATSLVGKPGTPKEQRVPMNCGVWRYHPVRKVFEVFAWGTTNPWGLDFDDYGEMFITNCVIKHVFHVIPGAHYVRMYGQDLNPHCYGLMESCADHIHWAGGNWTDSRGGVGAHSEPGGGHAHVGAMIYLGDHWPAEYRNRIFMCNLHGNRLNQDILERSGSGYVIHHGKDFLMANDPWFRGIAVTQSANGDAYVADWCDTGECHNYDHVTPTRGRIYKVKYSETINTIRRPDLNNLQDFAKLNDETLCLYQWDKNDWRARHARRLLQERAAEGKLEDGDRSRLLEMLQIAPNTPQKLRGLWALKAIRGADEGLLISLLDHAEPALRSWAVRLLVDDGKVSDGIAAKLGALAVREQSPAVRLALAAALQRLSPSQRWAIAEVLVSHSEDTADQNLPLMIWYGIEPLIPSDVERSAALLMKARVPLVRQYIARRIAEMTE